MPSWLNSLKDIGLETAARHFLNSRLDGYGKIEQLKIDTKAHLLEVQFCLEGENTTIGVILRGYEIRESGGDTFFSPSANGFATTRPWLTRLLNAQAAGRDFLLPPKYARQIRGWVG